METDGARADIGTMVQKHTNKNLIKYLNIQIYPLKNLEKYSHQPRDTTRDSFSSGETHGPCGDEVGIHIFKN